MPSIANLSKTDFAWFLHYNITPEYLAGDVVRRVHNSEAREEYGICFDPAADLSGLLFLYYDPLSGLHVNHRLRLDDPPIKDGRPVKYLSLPSRSRFPRRLYFAPGAGSFLKDVTVPVVIVESEKSVLAITAAAKRNGWTLLWIATGGVSGWLLEGKLLHDFDYITWKCRSAVILFDSDARDKIGVRAARRKLAAYLAGLGAIVGLAT